MPDFMTLAEKLGFPFKDKELLMEALTHSSYLHEARRHVGNHNERLEFLGDAVLQLAAAHHLFAKFPDKPEGQLTPFRSALVNEQTLAALAEELGFDDMMLLSKGEMKSPTKGRDKVATSILADAFEAFLGALYLDQGYEAAEKFLNTYLFPKLDSVIENQSWKDAKSLLQEASQGKRGITPSYSILKQVGPDHAKEFTVGVQLAKETIAEGKGKTKQEAEQAAARAALETLGW